MLLLKKGEGRGHISFRLPPERHGELLELMSLLGIDMTALLNQMIVDALPAYLEKARRLTEARLKARAALDEVTLTAEHPRVRELIRAGAHLPDSQRLPTLVDLALRHRKQGDPPLEVTVLAALTHLREDDQLKAIRLAIEDSAAAAKRGRQGQGDQG
jgi:hypothetical protein